MLRRMFGLPGAPDASASAPSAGEAAAAAGTGSSTAAAETATVREIVAQLDALPDERAQFLAAFAYVLSRAAQADLSISEAETREMERIVVEHGRIPEAQAVIVIQIAKTRSVLFGATEDYLVTREFRYIATADECVDLLRCCFLISASDESITAEESATLMSIADELGVDEPVVRSIRAEHAEQFAALQEMRRRTATSETG